MRESNGSVELLVGFLWRDEAVGLNGLHSVCMLRNSKQEDYGIERKGRLIERRRRRRSRTYVTTELTIQRELNIVSFCPLIVDYIESLWTNQSIFFLFFLRVVQPEGG